MRKIFSNMFKDIFTDSLRIAWGIILGTILAILDFFSPIKSLVLFLILFFFADMVVGYWAAKKVKKQKFSMKIIWETTIPRFFLSVLTILLCFIWDEIYQQNVVATYRVWGWFVSGVLLANILQNGYRITRWGVFVNLWEFVKSKFTSEGINHEFKNQKINIENENN